MHDPWLILLGARRGDRASSDALRDALAEAGSIAELARRWGVQRRPIERTLARAPSLDPRTPASRREAHRIGWHSAQLRKKTLGA